MTWLTFPSGNRKIKFQLRHFRTHEFLFFVDLLKFGILHKPNVLWVNRKTLVSFRNLDLSKFCIGQKDEMQQPPIYDLYAVINHYGGMIGGHYTAYARLPNDKNSQRSDVGEAPVCEAYSFMFVLISGPFSLILPSPPRSKAGVCLMTAP